MWWSVPVFEEAQEGQSFCQPLLHSKFQANLGYVRLSLCMFSFTSAIAILKVKRKLISSLVGYLSHLWFSLLSCMIEKNRKAMFCPLTVSSGLGADIGSSSYNWALIACLLKFILTHKNICFHSHHHHYLSVEDSNLGLCMLEKLLQSCIPSPLESLGSKFRDSLS